MSRSKDGNGDQTLELSIEGELDDGSPDDGNPGDRIEDRERDQDFGSTDKPSGTLPSADCEDLPAL